MDGDAEQHVDLARLSEELSAQQKLTEQELSRSRALQELWHLQITVQSLRQTLVSDPSDSTTDDLRSAIGRIRFLSDQLLN